MRRVRHSKSGLFLIELMICILFFSCTAGICIRFFAKSHELSQKARNLYQAQQEASSMAEILEGGTDSLYHRYVYYDKDWKQCEKKDMVYWLEVSETDVKKKEAENKTGDNSDSKKTDLKKIKIAVYSGKEAERAQKDEIYHLNLYECMSGGICCAILTKCIIRLYTYEEDGGAYNAVL